MTQLKPPDHLYNRISLGCQFLDDYARADDFLGVTSREVVRLFLEQLRFDFVPVFHGLQGRFTA